MIKCLTRSDARIAPQCPLYAECGGCNLQHLSHEAKSPPSSSR
ncbi:hypothetical protein JCM19237_4472 [Photobacterium aphoticum]|uniref:23S rRNA (Uracil-5-)-methyltransferase RumA n=1 Tax=Photobacterium aphoticum TaxID=754436 RepID=A0A090R299_9GAMM|nr:hypothetical protein JCM19237_4472 [Photobacterium aphoticum]